jgi:phage terminase large subunit GpA-like protein
MAKAKKKSRPRGVWASRTGKRKAWHAGTSATLRPPPKLTLSQWADENFRLSAESAAAPGRWKTIAWQRGIMDAISDPSVTWVSMQKAARLGFTKMCNATIGYYIDSDPCPIMVVQPTVEDAEGYSKEEVQVMIRDCPVLAGRVSDAARTSEQTILHKVFPGGSLSMVGANSGRGFRRVSRRVVIFDEVDGYPPSAGAEGDQIKLGARRAEFYWNRKLIAGSTPLEAGTSRIEAMYEAGDRRRYYVPCPHCGHMDFLRFSTRDDDEGADGHVMRWPKEPDRPELAHFVCSAKGCIIEETHKRDMIERGEWRAQAPFKGHASFWIWSAYSSSPNATWQQLVQEYLEAKDNPAKLKTYWNTVLGLTWKERGEAPDWERLYERRESYPIGTLPVTPLCITCGVDVQGNRLIYEIVAWLDDKQSYSIDAGELMGDTSLDETQPGSPWAQLNDLLNRSFAGPDGTEHHIWLTAVDSGYSTQAVYGWARKHPERVIATKGVSGARALIGTATQVDVTVSGHKIPRGYRVYPIGVDLAKSELYGLLRLRRTDAGYPPGFCHFPEYEGDFFKQLTAEQLVMKTNKVSGRETLAWHQLPNRDNHFLDCRVLNRAAVSLLGIDRMTKPPPTAPNPATTSLAPAAQAADESTIRRPNWISGARRPERGWLKRP